MTRPTARLAYSALWGLLIALYLIVPLQHLNAYAWDYDEGPYLQAGALATRGYPLYTEIVLNKLPFLTWLLQASFVLGGLTLATERLTVLLVTLIGFVSLGLLAELWWGKGAGPATMAVGLMIPEAVVRADVVMNDLPAMSLVLAAMVTATLFRQRTQWRWLFASALAFALAVGMHPLLLFTCVPIFWICFTPQRDAALDFRKILRILAVFGSSGVAILGATLILVDLSGFTRWVYDYNTTAAQNAGQSLVWPLLAEYLRVHWRLLVLATCSVVPLALTQYRLGISTSIVWTFMTLVTLTLYRPLWQHYLIFLLYPLIVIAGGGIATSIKLLQWPKRASPRHAMLRWITGIASLYLVALLGYQRLRVPPNWQPWPSGNAAAGAYLEQMTDPGDFIATDNPFFAFEHGYPVPPELADTSFKRICNGYLNIGDVVSAIHAHNVRFLVLDYDEGRFYHFPDLMRGIEAFADVTKHFDTLYVYQVRAYHPAEAVLGEAIRLIGYTVIEDTTLQTGGLMTVTLYWESLSPVAEDLSVFVHLLDGNGNLVAQHDGPPLFGIAPTSVWKAGMIIPDPHSFVLAADISSGTYTVTVGLYRQPSLERLPAVDASGTRWQNDAIVLTEIDVVKP